MNYWNDFFITIFVGAMAFFMLWRWTHKPNQPLEWQDGPDIFDWDEGSQKEAKKKKVKEVEEDNEDDDFEDD